jgi:hypothetical protein
LHLVHTKEDKILKCATKADYKSRVIKSRGLFLSLGAYSWWLLSVGANVPYLLGMPTFKFLFRFEFKYE